MECKHGQLKRSCRICELEAENRRLRAAISKYLYESTKGKQDEFDLAEALEGE